MLHLLHALLLLLQLVQMDACLFCYEEIDVLLRRVHPLHHKKLLEVFFYADLRFGGSEVRVEMSFGREEECDVFFVVVGEISDDVDLAEVDDLQVVLVDDVEGGLVVENGDVAADIEEVFAMWGQVLFYFVEFGVLFGVD